MTDFFLALAQQAVVDEDARQLRADRPIEQRRHDRRIDPARQAADHPVVAHPLADAVDGLLGKIAQPPGAVAAADLGQEVGQDLLALRACASPRDGTAGRRSAAWRA